MNNLYPLRNIRYFNSYNSQTKQLEYSKYNFIFEKYQSDFNLLNKSKLEIFDHFLNNHGWDYKKPTIVKPEFRDYFFQ